jgi:hypothetical protein
MKRRDLLRGAMAVASEGMLFADDRWYGTGPPSQPDQLGLPPIQDVLLHYHSLRPANRGIEPVGSAELRREVNRAWSSFQCSRYSLLADELPGLLAVARLSARELDDDDGAHAAGLLSEVYQLAAIVLLKQGDSSNLGWIAADRGMLEAERSGSPLVAAGSARILAYALLGAGHSAKAKQLCQDAATMLQPGLGTASPAHLSAYGALLLKGAIAASKQGDRATTQACLDEAEETAVRLGGDANHLFTAFGPTNVTVHRVSAALELGDGGTAVDHASKVHPARLPVLERRAHHLIEVARGYGQWGRNSEALQALLQAERLAPEEVRVQPAARALVADLLHRTPRRTPELRALAGRLGAVA